MKGNTKKKGKEGRKSPFFLPGVLGASYTLTLRNFGHTLHLKSLEINPSAEIAISFKVTISTGSACSASFIRRILPRRRASDTDVKQMVSLNIIKIG